jgi:hypothetical protein
MGTSILREQSEISFTEGTMDPENFTVQQRIIVAGVSLNKRLYPDRVLQEAAHLLEGVKTYEDHDSFFKSHGIANLTGYLTDPVYREGAIYATRHVRGKAREWLWPMIVDVVEGKAPADFFGCSINAIGKGREADSTDPDGCSVVVESISAFHSVDDVTSPAAGGGFVPLTAGVDDLTRQLLDAFEYQDWLEARPDYVEKMKNEWSTVRQTDAIKAANADADSYKLALEELQAKQGNDAKLLDQLIEARRELSVHKVLADVTMPVDWKADLQKRLIGAADPDEWAGIIEAEQRKAKHIPRAKPEVVGAGQRITETEQIEQSVENLVVPQGDENYEQWFKRVGKG